MASSYSTRLRFELPATGEQSGTWGQTMNAFVGTFLEDAIAGFSYVNVTAGDYTLTVGVPGGTTEEARRAVLVVTGSPAAARNVIIPAVQKLYTVINQTGQAVTVKVAGQTGAAVPAGSTLMVACDGATTSPTTLPYGGSAVLALGGGLSVNGNVGVTGSLATTGGASFGNTPTTTTAINAVSSTSAFAIDIFGRALDSIGCLRFLDKTGGTELARLQSGAGVGTLALNLGNGGATGVFTTDTAGNITFSKQATVSGYFTTSAGATVGGALSVQGDTTTVRQNSPTTGYLYFGNSGTRYIGWDGSNYVVGGSAIWTTANFSPSSYAPLSGPTFTGQIWTTSQQVRCGTGEGNNKQFRLHNSARIVDFYLNTDATAGLADINSGVSRWWTDSSGNMTVQRCVNAAAPRGPAGGSGNAMVNGDNRFGQFSWNGSGYIDGDVDGTGFGISIFFSDERRKLDIQESEEEVLPLLRRLKFIDFRFKPTAGAPADLVLPMQRGGISAQQASTIKPEWVQTLGDAQGTLMPNVQLLLTNALKAIVELDAKVQALEARLAALPA